MNNALDFKGLRVLNTRPAHLAGKTSRHIIKAGGTPVMLPLLTIAATPPSWLESLPPLQSMQHAIFTSPNAVTYFFKHDKNQDFPNHICTYAIGPGTTHALRTGHILNVIQPEKPDSEHLLRLDNLIHVKHQNVLLVKGIGGRTLIEKTLVARGAHLIPVEVYQRLLPKYDSNTINSLWHEDAVDIILITSQTALQHLFALFGEKATPWLQSKPCLVISDRLAKAAHLSGFKTIITNQTGI
ncbi:MAG: uroporphyrinogen-III synthase [Legionellaceae bacterium]|nr:uroporphyrinogen-III synthase [Legionellaceae bacterium]